MPARHRSIEREGSEARAQHAADESALTFEELPHFLAARSPRRELVPAVGALAARRFATLDRQASPAVEHALPNARELRVPELSSHARAEIRGQRVHGALQLRGERAVRRDDLQGPVDARHRAHGDEAAPGAAREPFDQRRELLTGRTMQEENGRAGRKSLLHQPAVDAQLVARTGAGAKLGGLTIHGNAAGAYPLLRLTAGGESERREAISLIRGFARASQILAARTGSSPTEPTALVLAGQPGWDSQVERALEAVRTLGIDVVDAARAG